MFNRLKASFVQKQFMPLWLIITLLILLDISTRLTSYETEQNDTWKIASASKNVGFYLDQAQGKLIKSSIDAYQAAELETKSKANIGMSEADQLAQQGDLSQLYAGNIRYRLVGIFDKSGRFAVIQQLNIAENENKLIKVAMTESLQGYQVTEILSNKVILRSNDNRQVSLFLYKKLDAKPNEKPLNSKRN